MKRIVFILIICFWVGRVLAIDHRIPAVQDSVRLDTVKKSLQAQSLQHLLERDSLPLMTLPVDAQMKMSPVYLPDSLIRDTLRYEYTKIKDFAYKAKWTKELCPESGAPPASGLPELRRERPPTRIGRPK